MLDEKSCGAVLFKRQRDGSLKYALLHHEAGHWDFPKGHQEKNETEERASEREIREETGIDDIEIVNGFKEGVRYFFKKGEETVYKEVIFFLARTMTEKINLSSEHTGYAWVSYEHACKKLTYNTSKDLLKKADDFLKRA